MVVEGGKDVFQEQYKSGYVVIFWVNEEEGMKICRGTELVDGGGDGVDDGGIFWKVSTPEIRYNHLT